MRELRRRAGMVFCTGHDAEGRQHWAWISEASFVKWAKERTDAEHHPPRVRESIRRRAT